jgi:CRISPR/Cas system-associated exonuclease Cas4 (RecB family)
MSQIASEQELYSKMYGLKGKIDSVCEFEDYYGDKAVFAVELKTGMYKSTSYDFQVMLYSLLIQEVYDNASANNMLVYLHEPEKTQLVYWSDKTLDMLIQFRNKEISRMIDTGIPKQILGKLNVY